MTRAPDCLAHPAEEALTEFALGRSDPGIEQHLVECPACARLVKEMRYISREVQATAGEPVPPKTEKRITRLLRKNRSFLPLQLSQWLGRWYRVPFLWGLGMVALIIVSYLFIVFIL